MLPRSAGVAIQTIFLARHGSHAEVGHVLSGRSEIALNDVGLAEARALARRLAGVPLAAIHSSPRRRAVETAEIVAQARGLEVEIVDALDEIDFGDWRGCSFAELDGDPRWQAWNAARASTRCPNGERMAEATARAARHVASIVEDGPVLCVSHCDVIRGLVADTLRLDPDRLLAFDCDPGSLTTLLLYPNGDGRIVTLNERPSC